MDAIQIPEALEALADRLADRGVEAVTDPRDLNPPGALVTIDRIEDPTLCGDVEATATIYLVAPDNGARDYMQHLFELLSRLWEFAGGAVPDVFTLPDGGTAPALRLDPIPL